MHVWDSPSPSLAVIILRSPSLAEIIHPPPLPLLTSSSPSPSLAVARGRHRPLHALNIRKGGRCADARHPLTGRGGRKLPRRWACVTWSRGASSTCTKGATSGVTSTLPQQDSFNQKALAEHLQKHRSEGYVPVSVQRLGSEHRSWCMLSI